MQREEVSLELNAKGVREMKLSQDERMVKTVNVEIPYEMLKWIDSVATKYESSRSGVLRLAVRELIARTSKKSEEPKVTI